ncbi:MAG: 23S rRNA (adenine(2503)-C(2))-methyltransferase RlmN [Microthrixaceae bacterium]
MTEPLVLPRYGTDKELLANTLDDQPGHRADQVWADLYSQSRSPSEMTNLPAELRSRLTEQLAPSLELAARSVSDDGDTEKFLWALGGSGDGTTIETVLMKYPDRCTVCVSTQAGCAMACGFCATGQAGFDRQLDTGEIVEQVIEAARRAAPPQVSNVVFMGMGEPMANYDATWSAIRRLHDDVGIGARHITVSTVGIIPGILRMAAEDLPVNLAVSLHAANDELRDQLVPINRRYPLDDLAAACRRYLDAKHRRLSFEWAMIDSVNDRDSDAAELAAYARRLRAHVNLIPLNATPEYPTKGSPAARVAAFRDRLDELGVNATVRHNRGTEIDAACGQLRATHGVHIRTREV